MLSRFTNRNRRGWRRMLLAAPFLVLTGTSLRAQQFVRVTQADGGEYTIGSAIAVDGTGHSYVAGEFGGTVTLGAGEANETVLTGLGVGDQFLAKYDPFGALVWATHVAVNTSAEPLVIKSAAVDAAGNSHLTGLFYGAVTFDPGGPNETDLTAMGFDDVFIAKFGPNGGLRWLKHPGATGQDAGEGIAVTSTGGSVIGGRLAGTATFGAGEPGETTLVTPGDVDAFLAAYDAQGNLIWAKLVGGGNDSDVGLGVTVAESGETYVSGYFTGSATFGRGEPNETVLVSVDSVDIFVAAHGADGSLLWARQAGGSDSDVSTAIAVTGTGETRITGNIRGSATFGAGEPGETTLFAQGIFDGYVASYGSDGSLLWARHLTDPNLCSPSGIALDVEGNSYVSGLFDSSLTLAGGEPEETTLISAGSNDIFVAAHAPDGVLLWADRAGGSFSDRAFDVAVTPFGAVYATGPFSGTATFGEGGPNESTVTGTGLTNMFLAQYARNILPYGFCEADAPCGNVDRTGGCANSTGLGGRLEGSGSTSVAVDDLVLSASNLPPNQFGIFYMGAGQARQPFGDGLRSVSASGLGMCRFLPPQNTGGEGELTLGPGIVARSLSGICPIQAGERWNFQSWFRDPMGPCSSGFNLSNAVSVPFTP